VNGLLERYAPHAGEEEIRLLRRMAEPLEGRTLIHVNSTRKGGGVAEILERLVPLQNELGLRVSWEVVEGDESFFQATKALHNTLQGMPVPFTEAMREAYEETNRRNAERLRGILEEADFVFIHDPQPAMLRALCPGRRGRWVWRCHIDASTPVTSVWRYLSRWVEPYDASIFSLPDYAQPLPHPQYLIPPCIDPISEKNLPLEEREIQELLAPFGLDPDLPLALQVSRFDRFKDPVGVVQACRQAVRSEPLQLVLAGGGADDDPEGASVLEEVREAARELSFVKILVLPPDAHRIINALQRAATVVFQKSLREGFGLTVSEALWKERPVIGGDVGGIRFQVLDGRTGYRVRTPEGAGLRLLDLLQHPRDRRRMGTAGREHVREHFLLTRLLRNHLALLLGLQSGDPERLELFSGA
jgi:trehalose synthase